MQNQKVDNDLPVASEVKDYKNLIIKKKELLEKEYSIKEKQKLEEEQKMRDILLKIFRQKLDNTEFDLLRDELISMIINTTPLRDVSSDNKRPYKYDLNFNKFKNDLLNVMINEYNFSKDCDISFDYIYYNDNIRIILHLSKLPDKQNNGWCSLQ